MTGRDLDVMIVGVGRSGTTLLASMLQASPGIEVLPETQILRRVFVRSPRRLLAAPAEALRSDDNLKLYDVPVEDLIRLLPQEPTGRDIYRCYINSMVGDSDGLVVEKNPTAVDYLPLLRSLFPEVKVIHIRRSAPDVVKSRMKAGWSKDRSKEWHLVAYKSQIAAAERDRLKNPTLHYVVRYEDLVSNTESACKGIIRFLGRGEVSSMANYSATNHQPTTRSASWHDNIGKPVSSSSIGGGSSLPAGLRSRAEAIEARKLSLGTIPAEIGGWLHGLLRRGQAEFARRKLGEE